MRGVHCIVTSCAQHLSCVVKQHKRTRRMHRYDWEKIGDVVGGRGDTVATGGKTHAGQEWDYVFDVDAEEGAPPRKLPANRGEDPYAVADRFLIQEGLPVSYRRVPC